MDDIKSKTLGLIEEVCEFLPPKEAGYQLILIVGDYLNDWDLVTARRIMAKIPAEYLTDYLQHDIQNSAMVKMVVATLIEQFGLNFETLNKIGYSA